MMRRWAWLVLAVMLAGQTVSAAEFVMNELPDFSNERQWALVETVPLGTNVRGGRFYVWGTVKKHQLSEDKSIIGYQEYAYGSSEPYFKTWGREGERPFYALKESESGPWRIGPAGSSWWEVRVDPDRDGKIRGMWVLLFVRSTAQVYGRYFADPSYEAPPSTPKQEIRT